MEIKERVSSVPAAAPPSPPTEYLRGALPFPFAFPGAAAWWLIYRSLASFAAWATYSVLSLTAGSHLASAAGFFLYEAPKVLMLPAGSIRNFATLTDGVAGIPGRE